MHWESCLILLTHWCENKIFFSQHSFGITIQWSHVQATVALASTLHMRKMKPDDLGIILAQKIWGLWVLSQQGHAFRSLLALIW